MIERTLVLLKPDAVQRGVQGRILSRFEDAGFKMVGMKMAWVTEEFARKHYADLGQRRGKAVQDAMVKVLSAGPVLACCFEGVDAAENIRKMVGNTEPKSALPGTIRGDFAHVSFAYADKKGKGIENLIHASGNAPEAQQEIKLWFTDKELYSYKTVHEVHVF